MDQGVPLVSRYLTSFCSEIGLRSPYVPHHRCCGETHDPSLGHSFLEAENPRLSPWTALRFGRRSTWAGGWDIGTVLLERVPVAAAWPDGTDPHAFPHKGVVTRSSGTRWHQFPALSLPPGRPVALVLAIGSEVQLSRTRQGGTKVRYILSTVSPLLGRRGPGGDRGARPKEPQTPKLVAWPSTWSFPGRAADPHSVTPGVPLLSWLLRRNACSQALSCSQPTPL